MSSLETTAPDTRIAAIVDAIGSVVGEARPVHLHEPLFQGNERAYVTECIDTGWVSSVGKFVDRFEVEIAKACGTDFGVAVVNGTAALHMALHVIGVKAGDEVIIPTLTFVATANAIVHANATPHLIDCEERTLSMDPKALADRLNQVAERRDGAVYNRETGARIAAVMPVHMFGHPADMDAINAICAEWDLPVVEDATESLGSTYKGRPCGSLGLIGVLSFNGNKIVTTGGGGAIVCNDPDLAKRAKHVSSTAKLPHKWAFLHDELAWNYRMPNLNAALGVAQLENLAPYVKAKRKLARKYGDAFANMPGVRWVEEPEGSASNYWLNSVLLDDDSGAGRDALLEATHAAGLLTRPAWTLMHHLPMYADAPRGDVSVSESIERRLVNLPSSVMLGQR